jgi:hypothetical protein
MMIMIMIMMMMILLMVLLIDSSVDGLVVNDEMVHRVSTG